MHLTRLVPHNMIAINDPRKRWNSFFIHSIRFRTIVTLLTFRCVSFNPWYALPSSHFPHKVIAIFSVLSRSNFIVLLDFKASYFLCYHVYKNRIILVTLSLSAMLKERRDSRIRFFYASPQSINWFLFLKNRETWLFDSHSSKLKSPPVRNTMLLIQCNELFSSSPITV